MYICIMKTHLNTEVRIKEAAKIVFIKKGMSGARMQEIADEAGINKAMLHYYYRSKEKLFQTTFKEILDDFFPNILERFTDWALPATSIVAINQSVTGYLYFQVGTAYEAAKVGTVRFTASPARILRTFEQEIKLGVGK